MSGIKSYQLNLYEQNDATKALRMRVDPSAAYLDYKQHWDGEAEANLGFAMTKLSVDGLGDLKAYGLDRKAEIDVNASGLAAELIARAAQDTVLDGKITQEVADRTCGDSANATLIGTETANRVAADSAISATHTAYVTSNDAAVAAVIATQTANKASADSGIATNAAGLAQELLDRAAADTVIDGKVTVEQTARIAGDAGLQNSLDAEIAAARAAEAGLQTQITNLLANTDQVALNSLAEIVQDYQNVDAGHVARIATLEQQVAALLEFHN